MNTANLMSSLLNAAGLKERSAELSGKAKFHLVEFPTEDISKAVKEPVMDMSPSQIQGLAGDRDVGARPRGHEVNPDGAPTSDEIADALGDTANALDAHRLVSVTDWRGSAAVGSFSIENNATEETSDAASDTVIDLRSQSAGEEEATSSVSPEAVDVTMEQLPAHVVMPVHLSGSASPAPAVEAGLTRAPGRESQPLPTGMDVHSRQAGTGNAESMRGASSHSDLQPIVRVAEFKMFSSQADYPQNFSDRFSKQLDMMRPVFQAMPGREGLARVGEAGGLVSAPLSGNLVAGTVSQVQQSIQASLVNLARENTGSVPAARSMELSLVPRSLGEIKIHMMRSAGRIDVEIITNTASATQAMETAKTDIIKGYLLVGIQPEEVNIRITESRDGVQTALVAGSDENRTGQNPARNGAGFAMGEQQSHTSEQEQASQESSEGTGKTTETETRQSNGVMGKTRYF